MRRQILVLALALSGLTSPAPAQDAPRPQPRPVDARCTADGAHCIRLATYTEDTCRLIAAAAETHRIDTGFFARLLWRESLFDAGAVSRAGAQGIAQFMPATAALRKLDDPFNPARAIFASAEYLAELTARFGNPGLAAAAYNAGEARAERFLAAPDHILPGETRAYVRAITGHSARVWRDDPPEATDFALAPDEPFFDACTRQAGTRRVTEFTPPKPAWGVIIAAGRRRQTVEMFVKRVAREYPAILEGREIAIVEARMAGFGRRARLTAQVTTQGRDEAIALCRRMQDAGAYCQLAEN